MNQFDEFILSTFLDGGYTVWSGTSIAAPHVTAVVAMMLAAYGDLSPAMVKLMLQDAALELDYGLFVQFP